VIRRLILIALVTSGVAAATATPASAHATLEATTPEAGASLASAPAVVAMHFDEPVETALGAVRVYDARGRQVQDGGTFHPGGDASRLAVRLRAGLPKGGYTATFRVVSADSHAVSGGFGFAVGGAAAAGSVAELLVGQGSGPVTSAAFAAVRALQYGAIALGLGVLSILMAAWLPALRALATPSAGWRDASDVFARRARGLLLGSAVVGAGAGWLALPLQAATAQGTSLWSALGDAPQVLSTRFGTVWALGILAWLAVLTVVTGNGAVVPVLRPATVGAEGVALPGVGRWLGAAAVPLLALAFLPGLGGHAGVRQPVAVLLPVNVLHVLAAGAWIGGLAVLVLALPPAVRSLGGVERTQLRAGVVSRFSTLALAAVAVLLAGGILQSLLQLADVRGLVETPFGRAIALKIAVVVALLACGAVNRRRTIPALARAAAGGVPDDRASVALRRTLRIEIALGVAALAISGALAGYQPG
jgi:copper transport protein